MKKILLLFAILSLISCQEDFISPPLKQEKIDFNYRVSQNFQGLVKFNNNSECLDNFVWNFGFYQDGEEYKSTSSSPSIYFPSNGTYTVLLSGETEDGRVLQNLKEVIVDNY